MSWDPSRPWPGTEGGASSPQWGDHIRVFVRAGIEAGTPFHVGTHANDRLDAGNVLSWAGAPAPPPTYRELVTATVPSMVAYWPMDNQTGELFNQAGTGDVVVGVSTGSPVTAPGVEGGSRIYAGTGRDGAPFNLSTSMTIGCLFQRTTLGDNDGLHGKWASNNGVTLFVNTDQLAGAYGSGVLTGTTILDSSSWYFAMFSSGPTYGRRLWLNTNLEATTATATAHGTTGSPSGWEFAAYSNNSAATRFTGRLAHCWVSNVEVDAAAGAAIATALTPDAATKRSTREAPGRLWVDLSCDVTDLSVIAGSSGEPGIILQSEAGTCQVTLADPAGKYDPTNPESPYRYMGRTRLVPGVPVEVFAEVVDPVSSAISTHYLFTGTADSWGEDWTPRPGDRRARLMATDATKSWVRYDRPEQPPVGAGDTTEQRVQRLVDFYVWPGLVEHGPSSTVTLAATTLAQSGWELLGRTLDDEVGFVHFTTTGALRWTNRAAWFTSPPPVVVLGCQSIETGLYDVIVDASPSNSDANMRNVVRAARTGGTVQTAQSTPSVELHGPYEYKRTDLGMVDDTQAGQWATDVVTVSAFPRVWLSDVTLVPGIAPSSWDLWPVVLDVDYVTDAVRVVWAPPDRPSAVVETIARVVGSRHRITRGKWETVWQLGVAGISADSDVFTMGPHANAHLDSGNVLALAS